MINKITVSWIGMVLLLIFTNIVGFPQTDSKTKVIEAIKTANCEFAAMTVDGFAYNTDADKIIIIISYKGKKESKKDIASRRLYNAKTYFTEYYKGTSMLRSPEKVITAIGTDETEEGKLNFYVDGKLILTMFFLNNTDLNLSPCHTESKDYCKDEIKKLFFPCLEKIKRKTSN
jgi:hypothetical protein